MTFPSSHLFSPSVDDWQLIISKATPTDVCESELSLHDKWIFDSWALNWRQIRNRECFLQFLFTVDWLINYLATLWSVATRHLVCCSTSGGRCNLSPFFLTTKTLPFINQWSSYHLSWFLNGCQIWHPASSLICVIYCLSLGVWKIVYIMAQNKLSFAHSNVENKLFRNEYGEGHPSAVSFWENMKEIASTFIRMNQ